MVQENPADVTDRQRQPEGHVATMTCPPRAPGNERWALRRRRLKVARAALHWWSWTALRSARA